jgi:methylisocitrate lyase
MDNVAEEVRRIKSASHLPLLVDIDIGWFHVARSVKEIERAGADAIQIEDQTIEKKCGHLTGKAIVSIKEMTERIQGAAEGRKNPETMIVARIDAYANEGLQRTIERGQKYREAGADILFPEALTSLEEFSLFRKNVDAPVLANLTEFGKTPLLTLEELNQVNIEMALYPLSCARAMNKTAWEVLQTIRKQGTQKQCLAGMQTREELYKFLDYQP